MSLCKEEESELIFGWIDESRFTGAMFWHKVVHQYFWSLTLDDIKVIILYYYYLDWRNSPRPLQRKNLYNDSRFRYFMSSLAFLGS